MGWSANKFSCRQGKTLEIMTRKNIVLTGFMGTGKSTVGRLLSERLAYKFVDTDALIVARAGRPIAEIFRYSGETAFRKWEAVVSRDLSVKDGFVIATGGRLMLDEANAAALGANAYVFCLTAAPEVIIARLIVDQGVRPLLDVADPAGRVRELLAQRAEQYGRFPQIQTDDRKPMEIVEEIVKCISVT